MPLKPSTPNASASAEAAATTAPPCTSSGKASAATVPTEADSTSVRTRRVPPLAVGDAAPDHAGDAGADVEQREDDRRPRSC